MPTVGQAGFFNIQLDKNTGGLASQYRLYTYAPDTTTKKTVYTEPTGTTAHTYTSDGIGGEYIALNSRGELPAPLFLQAGGYDLTFKSNLGASIWTRRAYAVGLDALDGLADSTGSDSIGFIQAGTGADTRTVQDKLREWVSPEDFGAVGDGVTNDATALQEFLTYLADNGGNGIIGSKEYLTTAALALTNPAKGFSLRSAGPGSVIKQRTLTAVSCLSIIGAHDILMDGFKIDCGYSVTGFASHGISMRNAQSVTIQNVQIYDHRNTAILAFVDAADTYGDCHFINCLSDSLGNGQNGFLHEGMLRSSLQNCNVKPLDPAGSPCYGLQLKNVCRNSYISGGYAEGCKAGVAFGGDGSTYGDGPWNCYAEGVDVKDCLDGVVMSKTTNCRAILYADQTSSPTPTGSSGYAVNVAGFNDRAYVEAHIKGVQSGRTCVRISSDDTYVYIPYADGIGTYIARLEAGVNDANVVFGYSPQKPNDILSMIDDVSGQTDNEILSLRDLPQHGLGGSPFLRFPTPGQYQNYLTFNNATNTFTTRINGTDRMSLSATTLRPEPDIELTLGTEARNWTSIFGQQLALVDGVTAPATLSNHASIYIDQADGDLKIKFKDGTVKTISTDT
jgi:hypothetical protein